jgi:hypothetical protein
MMNPEYEQYWVQICPRIPHSVINHGYANFLPVQLETIMDLPVSEEDG